MDRREQAAVLALVAASESEWYRTAAIIEDAGSALRVADGAWEAAAPVDLIEAIQLGARVTDEMLDEYEALIEGLGADGVTLVTVLDDEYPANLRLVYNRPPFLFVRGELTAADDRAVAVVGTRQASPEGLEQTRRLAGELARAGVTVLSGLALGIDTAAHTAALQEGGRTVAVMGTGSRRIYPSENEDLAIQIVASGGALVSQFWPDAPPTKFTFPMRNAVMSGMAIGTVVVEASRTSGAKMQARLALDHGKRVFLVESLVMQEKWAQECSEHPSTTVVRSVDDILDVLVAMARPVEQLTLG
jgi:DNA processing protein